LVLQKLAPFVWFAKGCNLWRITAKE
jgi:hypothetical protein